MKTLRILIFGKDNRIGRRLIVLVIAFSSLITLCVSAVQLAYEYRGLRDALDRQLNDVGIYVPTIEGSVWDFDGKQIQRELDALILLPHVVVVRVTAADTGKQWAAGKALSPNTVTRTYTLRHDDRGKDTKIGTLEVIASLDAIDRKIVVNAISIFLSNGVQIFLVALFMIFLIHRMLTTRLEAMAYKVRELIPGMLPLRQVVETQPQPIPESLDELDAVDWAFDKTSEDLDIAVRALQSVNERLEQTVKERTHQLEAAIEELKAFSYTLSHDMRAPLRAMSGYSTVLREDFGDRLGDEGNAHLLRIAAAAKRMEALIDDTLSLYQVSASTFNGERVDLAKIAGEIAEQLVHDDPKRAVEWNIEEGMLAFCDAGLMRTVLENLIGNAWKYSGKRDVAQIAVGALKQADGTTVYYVKDNGAGFDMTHADHLFMPFQRLHHESDFPGNGIGLATVRKIIVRHEGRVWAEAEPDRGATFYFTLPG